jgi:hypothetical protein
MERFYAPLVLGTISNQFEIAATRYFQVVSLQIGDQEYGIAIKPSAFAI